MGYQFLDQRNAALCDTSRQVVEIEGRWYITLGNPGCNTKANNGQGYATEAQAREVLEKHTRK